MTTTELEAPAMRAASINDHVDLIHRALWTRDDYQEVLCACWDAQAVEGSLFAEWRPPPRAITEAEEAMLWLRWLEPELGKLVWAGISGSEWKPICWQFGISRPTARRRWEYGLSVIVWRLNGRRVPTKRSMRFVIERAAPSQPLVT